MLATPITTCRLCGHSEFDELIDLGEQALTGHFPLPNAPAVPTSSLLLVKCGTCHLVQLKHSYSLSALYGDRYGYRSSLNASMVAHLRDKVFALIQQFPLATGDLVADIGSNDGTTLSVYPKNIIPVGFDPSAGNLQPMYRPDAKLVVDFFSADRFREEFPGKKAKIVTSIAMFYDLEDPTDFMKQVESILAEDGVWHFEQSYLPAMLETTAYDTICHEHLEYYALRQIYRMTEEAGLKILDVSFNAVNGGSFALTVAKKSSVYPEATALIARILEDESRLGLDTLKPYALFKRNVYEHREQLLAALEKLRAEKKMVLGYGASTKGNVVLQFCGITPELVPAIAEVNADKFNCVTPGTKIPIISEKDAEKMHPDCFVVFPWHFKANILDREKKFIRRGGKFLFPLPKLEFV